LELVELNSRLTLAALQVSGRLGPLELETVFSGDHEVPPRTPKKVSAEIDAAGAILFASPSVAIRALIAYPGADDWNGGSYRRKRTKHEQAPCSGCQS
jgi:hypothetical protein